MLDHFLREGKSESAAFHALIEWARHTDTTPTQCAILKALIDRVNLSTEQLDANGLAAWPSYDMLVADTHYSLRTVGQAIRALLKKGLIFLGTEPVQLPDKSHVFLPASQILILRPPSNEYRGRQELPTPQAGAAYLGRQELPTPQAGAAYKVLREEKREVLKEEVMRDTTKDVASRSTSFDNSFLSVGDEEAAQRQHFDVTSQHQTLPTPRQDRWERS